MEKEQSHVTERILDLTLEIIYLLTGENYIAFKLSDGLVASNLVKTQRLLIESSSHSLRPNKMKVQEVTSEMIELLTGEVPTASFFMKEGQMDRYKDILMASQLPLTSSDGSSNRNPPERCPRPLYSRDSIQEHQEIPHDDQIVNQSDCRMKHRADTENTFLTGNEPWKKKEGLPEISTDPGDIKAEENEYVKIEVEEVLPQINTVPDDKVKVDYVRIKEEELPTLMSHDDENRKHSPQMLYIISQDDEVEDDDIGASSSEGHTTTATPVPVPHSTDLLSDHTIGEEHCLDQSDLATHQMAAKEAKAFPCSECGKCFTRKTTLNEHQRCHSGLKPYSCPVCGKSFSRRSHFIQHERTHTGERPYSCSECGKRFVQRSALAIHQRIHTAEKPYHCLECGKSFTQIGHYSSHQRTHTGVKPYSCSECGKCFSMKSALIRHQRLHAVPS